MCLRTRTAAKISNPRAELLAARAGTLAPLGRDGRVAAAQVHAGAGRLVRKRAAGGGNVGRSAADGGVISRTPHKTCHTPAAETRHFILTASAIW